MVRTPRNVILILGLEYHDDRIVSTLVWFRTEPVHPCTFLQMFFAQVTKIFVSLSVCRIRIPRCWPIFSTHLCTTALSGSVPSFHVRSLNWLYKKIYGLGKL